MISAAFVELETVLGGQNHEAAEAEHTFLRAYLGLGAAVTIAGSYSDLLMARSA